MFPFRRWTALVAVGLVTPIASTAQRPEVCTERNLLYRLDGGDLLWSDVRWVSTNDSLLVVMTKSDPVIHLFDLADGSRHRSWGRRGEGPGEFGTSTGIAFAGRHIFALDTKLDRLSIFEFTGDLVRTMRLDDLGISPPQTAIRLERTGGARPS